VGRKALDRIALPLSRRIKAKSNKKTKAGKSIGRFTLINFKIASVEFDGRIFLQVTSSDQTVPSFSKKSALKPFKSPARFEKFRLGEYQV
jgi:hypothetical protein